MTTPTQVWTILYKDRTGSPRGFEKGDGYYYLTEEDAKAAHDDMEEHKDKCTVVDCVIMSKQEYEALTQAPLLTRLASL